MIRINGPMQLPICSSTEAFWTPTVNVQMDIERSRPMTRLRAEVDLLTAPITWGDTRLL